MAFHFGPSKGHVTDHTNFYTEPISATYKVFFIQPLYNYFKLQQIGEMHSNFLSDLVWSLFLVPKKEDNALTGFAKMLYSFLIVSGR